MDSKLLRKAREAADCMDAVVADIQAKPDLPPTDWAPRIIAALGGDAEVFWVLDEKPGLFNGYNRYHPYLRQVRNSPLYGPRMFDSFRAAGRGGER